VWHSSRHKYHYFVVGCGNNRSKFYETVHNFNYNLPFLWTLLPMYCASVCFLCLSVSSPLTTSRKGQFSVRNNRLVFIFPMLLILFAFVWLLIVWKLAFSRSLTECADNDPLWSVATNMECEFLYEAKWWKFSVVVAPTSPLVSMRVCKLAWSLRNPVFLSARM
jgi:hypothetical protein